MRPLRKRSAPRGATLIELMISMTILAVALTGFVGSMNSAATASGVAHRRTVGTFLRSGLLDRFAVTQRRVVSELPPDVWIIEDCLDADSQFVARNAAHDVAFTCPAGAAYQSWIRVVPQGTGAWTLETYVERIDRGCLPEHRHASIGCVAAEILLTD